MVGASCWNSSIILRVLGLQHLISAKNTTDPAQDRARRLCSQLTLDEKIMMVHGTDGPYVGNVAAIPRLGIPPLNMNDGPQGFRGTAGTSTAWPCALSMAATWDEELVYKWGEAMAKEFLGKEQMSFLVQG
jgi:beta-glucosidase